MRRAPFASFSFNFSDISMSEKCYFFLPLISGGRTSRRERPGPGSPTMNVSSGFFAGLASTPRLEKVTRYPHGSVGGGFGVGKSLLAFLFMLFMPQ